MEILRSPGNATVRRLALLRNHRRRRAAARVLVDGAKETLRAIDAGLTLLGFYESLGKDDSLDAAADDELPRVRRIADQRGVHVGVDAELFTKIAYGQTLDRCVAEFEAPRRDAGDLPILRGGFILVLDRVEKPGNVGAIFRTADAAGVRAILMSDCPGDPFNTNAIRASRGAVFHVPFYAADRASIAEHLVAAEARVYAMRVESSKPLYHADLTGTVAVILGNEADGLGGRFDRLGSGNVCVSGIAVPMVGRGDSLNVSIAAGVVAYEAYRQRTDRPAPRPS